MNLHALCWLLGWASLVVIFSVIATNFYKMIDFCGVMVSIGICGFIVQLIMMSVNDYSYDRIEYKKFEFVKGENSGLLVLDNKKLIIDEVSLYKKLSSSKIKAIVWKRGINAWGFSKGDQLYKENIEVIE